MATDEESLSFRNSDDDDTFWKKESSKVQEENSTQETQSLNVESSSCFLSEEEIEHCLDSPQIKYNFTDINNIGAGGFGSVYEAVHTIENRKYALKFVKCFSSDLDKREDQIMASLDHPNVLRYYTSWITPFHEWNSCTKGSGIENSGCIVSFETDITPSENNENNFAMASAEPKSKNGKSSEVEYDACLVIQTELCSPNKNLQTLIDEGELFTMSDENRLNLFLDIVFGLQYIHKKGIMHRDLKPPNILLDKNNRAKIGDFGFARKCKISPADETPENGFTQNLGTYLYIAPEVRKSTVYDRKADLYGLGMILFEMYHKMGSGMERIKTMENLKNQEFSDLKNIPVRFRYIRRLIKSLLSHDPSERMTLKRIIKKISQLEQQQCVEKNKVQPKPRIVTTKRHASSKKPTFQRSNEVKAEEEMLLLTEYSRLQRTIMLNTAKCCEMLRYKYNELIDDCRKRKEKYLLKYKFHQSE